MIRFNRGIIAVSITLFAVALTQKCYCTTASCGDSLAVLLSGAIGFVFGGAALTWLANPLLIISWFINSKKPKLSIILSLFAVLLALSFLLFKRIISDEAGNYSQIVSYQLGYWLWLSSSAVMFLGSTASFYFLKPST
jgi:hypothetical protein